MSCAPAVRTPRIGLRFAQVRRGLPYAVYTVVIAAVLGCGMAIAYMRSPSTARSAHQADGSMTPADAGHAGEPRVRRRCSNCGVVESIRTLEATGKLPDQFEFTVRMRDGSKRVSRTTGRGQWRVGDRIILMTGVHARGA